ncbi:MAG TPA: NADH-quinone oxidoreductase subunit NuoG [Chitinophagales bacterium]|nr:NADH-quinone oxidoreductase subunit NuoG [Chitinophagales bacterium]
MITLKIDDFEILSKPNISILEACKLVGINIPRFCYHELLSVSGNCRMCLVEIENAEKPVASCVTEVENGMSVLSNTPFVQKARENVVEALLLNHPLDCPICDQAGECDLQDQVKKHGSNFSRFFFKKTSVEDKYCGPLIKTIMTRCIACTRCVRYTSEIAGMDFYGTLNRGGNTEIGSYVPSFFKSEISGNVVDLCPVGALTSFPYASKARPWELRITESIDTTDSLNSNIYVNFKETEVMRVLPKANNSINDSLISDRARYTYDANSINRIIATLGPSSVTENKKVKLGWKKFLPKFDKIIESKKVKFLIDDQLDFESLITLKKINSLYPNTTSIESFYANKNGNFYTNVNNSLSDAIENVDSLVLFLGTNPKIESAILNTKIRIKAKNNLVTLYTSGLSYDYNYLNNFINLNSSELIKGLDGKLKAFGKSLIGSSNSLILIGNSLKDRISNLQSLKRVLNANIPTATIVHFGLKGNSEAFNLFNFRSASYVNSTNNTVNFFVKNDDNVITRKIFNAGSDQTIWYNTHGSNLAEISNYVLPASSHFEKEQIYINLEHRAQKTLKALEISKGCKDLTSILISSYNLSTEFKNTNFKGSFEYLKEIVDDKNQFDQLKDIRFGFKMRLNTLTNTKAFKISKYPLTQKLKNFYLTDTFSRNSIIMKNCSNELKATFSNF